MSSFGERLFQEAKEREERQRKRSTTRKHTFIPKLVSTGSNDGVTTERVSNEKDFGERMYAVANKNEMKRKKREETRIRNETVNCTFEPAFVLSNKRRPTRPILESSPAGFKRKVKQIFKLIDENKSGTLSLKELKKGILRVPELSEIIAPGRSKDAYERMSQQANKNDGVTLAQFQSFCTNATSLRHLDTFDRRVDFIFDKMDVNKSAMIDIAELRRGIINIPELSEIIAPGRVQAAMDFMKNETKHKGQMTREDFHKFCITGASINFVADTPERASARMYRDAKTTLEQRDRSHVLQLQKRAAEIDAECTFVPTLFTTKEFGRKALSRSNEGTSSSSSSSSSDSQISRFDRLYMEGTTRRQEMDERAIRERKHAERRLVDACSFSPKVNHIQSPSSAFSPSSGGMQPTPPSVGSSLTKKNAMAASERLYKAAVNQQQRALDRESRRIRLEGDQCTFHPEITEMGYESKGTKYRYGPLSALQPGIQSTGERLYGAGLHERKKKDKVHKDEAMMGLYGAGEDFTFHPEISPRSQEITNEKTFDERLYEQGQQRLKRRKEAEKRKSKILTFQPKTNVKRRTTHFHASVGVSVPQNYFGLPVSAGITSKSSSLEDVTWYVLLFVVYCLFVCLFDCLPMHYTVANILYNIIVIIIIIFSFHFSFPEFHFLSLLSFFYRLSIPPPSPLTLLVQVLQENTRAKIIQSTCTAIVSIRTEAAPVT